MSLHVGADGAGGRDDDVALPPPESMVAHAACQGEEVRKKAVENHL